MTDPEKFRTRFPEFAPPTYSDDRINMFIDDAATLYMGTDELHWKGRYDIAQEYLVAHMLAAATAQQMGDASAKAGPITQASAGGVSVTRGAVAADRGDTDNWLLTTSYGQQFLAIRNRTFVGVLTATNAS